MRFSDDYLREIAERNPIEEVVGEYVALTKRSGINIFGLCPFHGEKTPSFSVCPSRGIYHCFGLRQGRERNKLHHGDRASGLPGGGGVPREAGGDAPAGARRRPARGAQVPALRPQPRRGPAGSTPSSRRPPGRPRRITWPGGKFPPARPKTSASASRRTAGTRSRAP